MPENRITERGFEHMEFYQDALKLLQAA